MRSLGVVTAVGVSITGGKVTLHWILFWEWIHHSLFTALSNCWATHTVADLYWKSGSDGQGHTLLLKVYLAPDPTEGETFTWIIFWQKSRNILFNILLFLVVKFGTSLHWHVLYAAIFGFYFGNNESNQTPSETWPSSPTIPSINPPSGPVLSLQPRRSCSVFPEPDQWL